MSVRLAAAACMIMLPLCSNAVASPLGVLTAPFASKVLVQQREQAARDNRAEGSTGQARSASCQATRPEPADDKPARCDNSAGNTVADRGAAAGNAAPDPDKKRTSD